MLTPEPLTYTVPLSLSAHAIAQDCTAHLGDHRRDQYLNILAVLSAQYFLQSLGVDVKMEELNALWVTMMPISDIELPGLGQLHCQAILPEETHLAIPEEVEHDRIGYLAIQFREDLRESTILGFTETPHPSLPLDELADVEAFLTHLSHLEESAAQNQTQPSDSVVHLRDWLTGTITQGWSELSDILNPPQAQLAFRGDRPPVTRGQPINMGMHLGHHALALLISIVEDAGQTLDLKVQLHPREESYLPPRLQLQIQNTNTGDVIASTTARERDNMVQLSLEADPGDRFRTIVRYEHEEITQDFLV